MTRLVDPDLLLPLIFDVIIEEFPDIVDFKLHSSIYTSSDNTRELLFLGKRRPNSRSKVRKPSLISIKIDTDLKRVRERVQVLQLTSGSKNSVGIDFSFYLSKISNEIELIPRVISHSDSICEAYFSAMQSIFSSESLTEQDFKNPVLSYKAEKE